MGFRELLHYGKDENLSGGLHTIWTDCESIQENAYFYIFTALCSCLILGGCCGHREEHSFLNLNNGMSIIVYPSGYTSQRLLGQSIIKSDFIQMLTIQKKMESIFTNFSPPLPQMGSVSFSSLNQCTWTAAWMSLKNGGFTTFTRWDGACGEGLRVSAFIRNVLSDKKKN